jgi:hypothetical protein
LGHLLLELRGLLHHFFEVHRNEGVKNWAGRGRAEYDQIPVSGFST